MLKEYCTQNNNICYTCSLTNYKKDCKNKSITDLDILISNSIEHLEEMNKVKVSDISNIAELQENLKERNYNTKLNGDYLILE
jgi:hypothetical protein